MTSYKDEFHSEDIRDVDDFTNTTNNTESHFPHLVLNAATITFQCLILTILITLSRIGNNRTQPVNLMGKLQQQTQ
jgi:hypothetical protein